MSGICALGARLELFVEFAFSMTRVMCRWLLIINTNAFCNDIWTVAMALGRARNLSKENYFVSFNDKLPHNMVSYSVYKRDDDWGFGDE